MSDWVETLRRSILRNEAANAQQLERLQREAEEKQAMSMIRTIELTPRLEVTRNIGIDPYPQVNGVPGCCGIKEITGIRQLGGGMSPEEAMKQIVQQRNTWFNGYILFSDMTGYENGTRFTKFIEENRLGTVVHIEPTLNRNSRNRIEMWVWTVDHTRLEEWALANNHVQLRKEAA